MAYFTIILAAGASTRMGTCKSSLLWREGKTLLTYQLEQWLNLGFTPLVVLGSHNSHRQKDCPIGSLVVINPHTSTGKTSSLLAGLNQTPPDFEILAISAIDQPRELNIYQQLLQAHEETSALITAPTHQGKIGHPLLFANDMRSHLVNIREETLGLRQIIKDFYPLIHKVEFQNPDVLLDINTPEIYQKYSI
ncbi:nucleotidyltransferase family protein [Nostoc sp. CENA67]|uniref:Nucleotidyltransferase family protein n=1 Tax=Amazonocrinis nigriterrae CENA67 TaxID=2794033 RepID=A0A8J7HVH9_9NOST|nr:nucleotidyltransferase family protein [Amazonocrinis nigriterrae]MBH8566606.1 nucleotidyltransferase family protein [Amazonocrinis nigriterrae CENA67]